MSNYTDLAHSCLEGVDGDDSASLALLAEARVHALLGIEDAIRQLTAALTGDDKRAILIERNQ